MLADQINELLRDRLRTRMAAGLSRNKIKAATGITHPQINLYLAGKTLTLHNTALLASFLGAELRLDTGKVQHTTHNPTT